MQNFRAPYASEGPSEFWRRWHISLSSWLRDYLYIPLGGNRGSPARTQLNLFLTMLLGGLWHGAAWNFVLWGAYQGALLGLARTRVVDRLGTALLRIPLSPRVRTFAKRFLFFHAVCLGWALFRAESLEDCGVILSSLLDVRGWALGEWFEAVAMSGEGRYLFICFAVIVGVVVEQNLRPTGTDDVVAALWRRPPLVRAVLVLTVLGAAIIFSPETPPPFIYFQF
jgi:alginate O-acetyltransferase complex protein AlgI